MEVDITHKGEIMDISEVLKEKVHKAIAEQNLIGVVSYSDDEFNELLAYTKQYSRPFARGIGSYLSGDDEIHFATLVELAKRWKSDDDSDKGFWQYILGTMLDGGDSQRLYNAYTSLIKGLGDHGKILIADTDHKYYATILMHAFAPYKSMSAFFDFVYNIYKWDLDFAYADTDNEICNIATSGFCAVAKSLGGANVGVTIGSGVYGIKIGLRSMALGYKTRHCFTELIDKVLTTINLLRHRSTLLNNDYVINLVKEWWARKQDHDLVPNTSKLPIQSVPKQNISIKFLRREEDTYLCVPPIRFARGEYPKLWLSVYICNQSSPIVSKEVFTRTGEMTVTSVQEDIKLNDLLCEVADINIRVEIAENGETIFDKTIEKDFILFDNEKELTNRILKVGNYFVYSLSIDSLQTPTVINTVAANLYNIYPDDGEVLGSDNRQVFFANEMDSKVVTNKVQLVGESGICKWKYEEHDCKVFGNRINLLLPQNTSVNALELRVNGNSTLLSDLALNIDEGYFIVDITKLFPQYVLSEFIVYSHLTEKELIHTDIVLIKKLHIGFSKQIYFGDIDKSVRVSVGNQYKDLTWKTGQETVSCKLGNGRLFITIPQIKWRIDMGEWYYGPILDIIWYKNYFSNGSIFEVQSPIEADTINLYCLADGELQEIVRNTSLKYEIGKHIFANEKCKNQSFFLKFEGRDDQREICSVTTVERFVQEPPFTVNNGKLIFVGDKCFIGEKKPYFNICLKRIGKEEIVKKSTELINGVLSDVDEGIYWVQVSSPSAGLFVSGEKILWKGEYVFGDREKLKLNNLVLKINPICGSGGDSWKLISTGYYITELVRGQDSDTYSARLHYRYATGNKTDVCGYSECRIVILSSIALQVYVKDATGDYNTKFKCDTKGNLYSPHSNQIYTATNYHFTEVKNV